MLHRDLYRGRVIYGKTTWVYRDGARVKRHAPPSEWITVDAPALQIVSAELWAQAQARLDQTRRAYLRGTGEALGAA